MVQRYWLKSVARKRVAFFPNSEATFFIEDGSRGIGVRFMSVRERTQLRVKALKCWLSVKKVCRRSKTVGRQAQKQPSFKESVTAHQPRSMAAKMIRAKTNCRYVKIVAVVTICKEVHGLHRSFFVRRSGAVCDMDPRTSSNDRTVRISSAERTRVSQRSL